MTLTFYPNPNAQECGYTEMEIRTRQMWIYADVKCEHCGKEQPVAAMNGYPGRCVRCGEVTT